MRWVFVFIIIIFIIIIIIFITNNNNNNNNKYNNNNIIINKVIDCMCILIVKNDIFDTWRPRSLFGPMSNDSNDSIEQHR